MKIAVCDDSTEFSRSIKDRLIKIFSELNVKCDADTYFSGESLISSGVKYDMAFIDMEMPGINGIKTAEALKNTNRNIIIFFITAYEKYLDEAMDINAFRFIKKPPDEKRLKASVEKALRLIDSRDISFFLKNGRDRKIINSDDVIYVSIEGHSTKAVLRNETLVSSENMDFWESALKASFFVRVHKSFIINMKEITDYRRDRVILENKYEIPIAYRRQSGFRRYFLSFLGGR